MLKGYKCENVYGNANKAHDCGEFEDDYYHQYIGPLFCTAQLKFGPSISHYSTKIKIEKNTHFHLFYFIICGNERSSRITINTQVGSYVKATITTCESMILLHAKQNIIFMQYTHL